MGRLFKVATLRLILFASIIIAQEVDNASYKTKDKKNNEPLFEDLNQKEIIGYHDNLHYISNYLEESVDTISIQYRFDLCLCPKWYIEETNEPIWIESYRGNRYNYTDRELDSKVLKVFGYFYKYKAVPLDLYDFNYLSKKSVPNARIFKIEKIL